MFAIVILCDNFEDVQFGFSVFMEYLEKEEPYSIEEVYEYSYGVETIDGIRYIFIDYRFRPLFAKMENCDFTELGDFLEGYDDYFVKYG